MICEEYNRIFSKNEFYPLQKAFTTPHFLVLSIRFPGKTANLYIGRGNQFQGIFLGEKLPPSYLRVQDRLLDYLRKYLVGARIGKIVVDDKSMVSYFHFKNDHSDNTFLFGYKERQLFFGKQSRDEVYLSWSGETLESSNLLSLSESFGPDKITNTTNINTWSIEDYLKEEEKKIAGQPLQRKKEKFLTRKINNISEDLKNAQSWTLIQDDLKENRLSLDSDELKIHGQKIKLQGLDSFWLKRDMVFKKIKKLKKAEVILSDRLDESITEFENVKRGEFEFELTKEKVIQPLWVTHQGKSKTTNNDYKVKDFKIKNLTGIIGLDAASNDWIRGQASKEHYWFHIENYSGSHCIVKTDDSTQLTFEVLEAISSMLRDFSRLEILEIPVIYTQLKNIKGVKGTKGEVIVKKVKHLRFNYKDWKEIISIL
jgi:hypothetical protein